MYLIQGHSHTEADSLPQCNQGKWRFLLEDERGKAILHLWVGKYASMVDVEVNVQLLQICVAIKVRCDPVIIVVTSWYESQVMQYDDVILTATTQSTISYPMYVSHVRNASSTYRSTSRGQGSE
jgi:hypothetical protein